jgi:primosomal protein N' (replication factor Y)
MAAVSGESTAVASVINGMEAAFEILGPVPLEQPATGPAARAAHPSEEQVRALVRAPRARAGALAKALQAAQAGRSARKEGGGVRVQLDPAELI